MGGGGRWVGYSVAGFTFFSVIDLSIILWRFYKAWTVCRVKEGGGSLVKKNGCQLVNFVINLFTICNHLVDNRPRDTKGLRSLLVLLGYKFF